MKRGSRSCLVEEQRCRKDERERLPRATSKFMSLADFVTLLVVVAKLVTLPVTAALRENPVPAETASSTKTFCRFRRDDFVLCYWFS